MKKVVITLLILFAARFAKADSVLIEGFEYGNHDGETPIGWVSDDSSWVCGYLEKDHNRIPHTGNWYSYTNADDSWMFMELFLSSQLKYRIYFWAITDGEYDIEFWAGNGLSQSEMTTMLFSKNVNSDNYQRLSEYLETIAADYQFIGIHAVAHEGAYHLTMDDLYIEMVNRYDLEVLPYRKDTVMYPGTQALYHYTVQNTGYEELTVMMSPINAEYFTNISFYSDGTDNSNFHTVPNQLVDAGCHMTLAPNVAIGTYTWLDIMFTVSCDCLTRMATMWVNVLGTVTDFPVFQDFDANNFMNAGWIIMGDGAKRWQWSSDNGGMLLFKASETDESSLLFSPKMTLHETGNSLSVSMFRSDEQSNKNDRINIYFNTEMSLEGATLLETIHRSTTLSPATEESGWVEQGINFDSPSNTGFIIIEAVGDFGSDIMIDGIVIDNSPLSIEENSVNIGIYPNPSTGQVTIEGNGTISIVNCLGQEFLTKEVIDKETITLNSGIYFVKRGDGSAVKLIVR